MKKISTKLIVIFLVAFALGTISTYFYMRVRLAESRELTIRALVNAGERAMASQALNSTCSEAYTIVSACLSNLQTCNVSQATQKLDKLNQQSEEASKKIDQASEESAKIIEETLKWKGCHQEIKNGQVVHVVCYD